MSENINMNLVRVSGKHEINREIVIDEDVELKIKASCVKIETGSNQDGSVDKTYVLKPLSIELIV